LFWWRLLHNTVLIDSHLAIAIAANCVRSGATPTPLPLDSFSLQC
jgi:hypothetical protein